MIAEVIVDVAHSEIDRVFDYSFTDENVKIGCRVEVPFGYGTKEGFVIDIKQTTDVPAGKLKSVKKVLDDFPVINDECLELAK